MSLYQSNQVNPVLRAWQPQLAGQYRSSQGSTLLRTAPPTTPPSAAKGIPCPLALTQSIPGGQISVLCLSLAGELNAHSYTPLVETAGAYRSQGWRALLLDMSQTTAIELSGFLALLNIARLYSGKAMFDPDEGWELIRGPMRSTGPELGKYVKLLAPSPLARAALDRSPFCAFLERYADVESALVAFGKEEQRYFDLF